MLVQPAEGREGHGKLMQLISYTIDLNFMDLCSALRDWTVFSLPSFLALLSKSGCTSQVVLRSVSDRPDTHKRPSAFTISLPSGDSSD